MPDITMCPGNDCVQKESCYRFMATPSEYQSYFVYAPFKEDGTCDHYWEIVKPKADKEKKK